MADANRHQSSSQAERSGPRRHNISLLMNDDSNGSSIPWIDQFVGARSAYQRTQNIVRNDPHALLSRASQPPSTSVPDSSSNNHRAHEGFLPAWSFDEYSDQIEGSTAEAGPASHPQDPTLSEQPLESDRLQQSVRTNTNHNTLNAPSSVYRPHQLDHRGFDSWPSSTDREQYAIANSEGDLLFAPASGTSAMPVASSSQSKKRPHATQEEGSLPAKRSRISNDVEEIDLATDQGSDRAILEKEREELVHTQKGDDADQPKPIGKITCMICLDNFTNLTTTACGHIFCHECLTRALLSGEKAKDSSTANCPACRKSLKRKTKGHVIPLKLMTKKKFNSLHEKR